MFVPKKTLKIAPVVFALAVLFFAFLAYLWLNSYIIHHTMFSVFNASGYINMSDRDGNGKYWICTEENMSFEAFDYVRPEPDYLEMEVADGSFVTQNGETVDFHMTFEAESFYLTMYIGQDEYYGMGYYDYDKDEKDTYTIVFNHENWPKEYLGEDVRFLTFEEKL